MPLNLTEFIQMAEAFRRSTILLLVLGLFATGLSATPPEDIVLTAGQRLAAGETEGTREFFRRQIAENLLSLSRDPADLPFPRTPLERLSHLGSTVRILIVWEQSELLLARKGTGLPSALPSEFFEYASKIEATLTRIELEAGVTRSQISDRDRGNFELYRGNILDTLRNTVALVRGAVPDKEREGLLRKVNLRLDRSEDLKSFDARTGDLNNLFKLDQLSPRESIQPPPRSVPPPLRTVTAAEEPRVFEMLGKLFGAVMAGDLVTIETLVNPSLLTPEAKAGISEMRGWRLQSLGTVQVRELDAEHLVVKVSDWEAITLEGKLVRSEYNFVLRKTSSGSFVIEAEAF